MGRGRKRRDTHSEEEHKMSAENVDEKDTKNKVCPSQPDISTMDYEEKISKLEQQVTKLQQELRDFKTNCYCHGKKGNAGHVNQMEGNIGHVNQMEPDDSHHGFKEAGAHRKQSKSHQYKSTRKFGKDHQTTYEQNNADTHEMECIDAEHNRRKADTSSYQYSHNMRGKKASKEGFQTTNQGNDENSSKMNLVHNEHDSTETGACSKEYQAYHKRTTKETASSETAEQQNTVDAVDNWEDCNWEQNYEHQVLQDEESFLKMEEGKGANVDNLDKHDTHTYFDYNNYNDPKRYQTKEGSSRNKTFNCARENDKRKLLHNKKNIISEIDGDLFSAPDDYSLAHCVAADLSMGSGIAVTFKQKFKKVDELMGQRKKVGDVAILEDKGRYIYYLITKKYSTMKPRIGDLTESVHEMKKHIVKNEVTKLALPRIGCGLDRLDWREVRDVLENAFNDVDISIVVYNFTMDTSLHTPTSKKKFFVKEEKMKLVNMETQTFLLLFGTVSGDVDETMQDIDDKFSIIFDYKKSARKMGDIIELCKRNESLYILIVKESKNCSVSYSALMECLRKLLKSFRKYNGYYMGFEAFTDCNDDDDLTVHKIVNIFKIIFAHDNSELWICWPPSLEHIYENYQSVCQYRESNQHRKHEIGSYRSVSFK